jgi:hypothetical protein
MAYLTRIQIYRALIEAGSDGNPSLVFRGDPLGGIGLGERLEAYTYGELSITAEAWDEEEQFLADNASSMPAIWNSSNWLNRFLGATNPLPGAAKIGDRVTNATIPTRRREWYYYLKRINIFLNSLRYDEYAIFGNPDKMSDAAYLEAGLDESTGNYIPSITLQDVVRDTLKSFRDYYTTKNNGDLRSASLLTRYYAMAYASSGNAKTTYIGKSASMDDWDLSTFLGLERKAHQRPEPNLFTLNAAATNPAYPPSTTYVGTRLVIRIIALHNALYGSDIAPFNYDLTKVTLREVYYDGLLNNIDAAIRILIADIDTLRASNAGLLEDQRARIDEFIADSLEETNFSVRNPTETEISNITHNSKYKHYFSTTFQQGIIQAVPIIHNLYLTEQYFGDINLALAAPKIKALQILIGILLEDDTFQLTPNLSRPAAQNAIAAANGDQNFNYEARDFMLKMLINTPIEILKGIVELIDPHVAITKLIKTGSAAAFNNGVVALDAAAGQINSSLQAAFPDLDPPPQTSGEQMMGLIVCLIEAGFRLSDNGLYAAATQNSPNAPEEAPLNFFPTATLDGGIDFTGTVSGMIMAPPLPLGLLYLLLELIKNKLNETENVADTTPDPGCPPDEETN